METKPITNPLMTFSEPKMKKVKLTPISSTTGVLPPVLIIKTPVNPPKDGKLVGTSKKIPNSKSQISVTAQRSTSLSVGNNSVSPLVTQPRQSAPATASLSKSASCNVTLSVESRPNVTESRQKQTPASHPPQLQMSSVVMSSEGLVNVSSKSRHATPTVLTDHLQVRLSPLQHPSFLSIICPCVVSLDLTLQKIAI